MPRTYYAACPPAVRTLVILAWAKQTPADIPSGQWSADHEIFPVVALRFFNEHDKVESDDFGYAIEPIIVDSFNLDFCTPEALVASDSIYLVVAAPWEPEQDAERLAPFITEAEKQAINKARFQESLP